MRRRRLRARVVHLVGSMGFLAGDAMGAIAGRFNGRCFVNGSTRWRAWLVATAIFILGLAVGIAGTTWAGLRIFRQNLQNPGSNRSFADRAAERIGADLADTLKLNAAESTRVQTILDQSATNLKALRVRGALLAAAELRASSEKIAATLPPEKRVEFYRVITQRYERLGLQPPRPANNTP